jgi:hypothetical protein
LYIQGVIRIKQSILDYFLLLSLPIWMHFSLHSIHCRLAGGGLVFDDSLDDQDHLEAVWKQERPACSKFNLRKRKKSTQGYIQQVERVQIIMMPSLPLELLG